MYSLVEAPGGPCTLQLTKTFGSKRPASYFELLLYIRVLLVNDSAVPLYVVVCMSSPVTVGYRYR